MKSNFTTGTGTDQGEIPVSRESLEMPLSIPDVWTWGWRQIPRVGGDMRLSLEVGKEFGVFRVQNGVLVHNSLQASNVAEIERFLPLWHRDFAQGKYKNLLDKCINLHGELHPMFSVLTYSQSHIQHNRNIAQSMAPISMPGIQISGWKVCM